MSRVLIEDKEADIMEMIVELLECNKYTHYIDGSTYKLCVKNCNDTVILKIPLSSDNLNLGGGGCFFDEDSHPLRFTTYYPKLAEAVALKCKEIEERRKREKIEKRMISLDKWKDYLKTVGGFK